jgi:hypothetical protein
MPRLHKPVLEVEHIAQRPVGILIM